MSSRWRRRRGETNWSEEEGREERKAEGGISRGDPYANVNLEERRGISKVGNAKRGGRKMLHENVDTHTHIRHTSGTKAGRRSSRRTLLPFHAFFLLLFLLPFPHWLCLLSTLLQKKKMRGERIWKFC